MSGLDFETIFTTDITDLIADAGDAPEPAFYMIAGAGPSSVRYGDLQTAREQAKALADANPDEAYFLMAAVEAVAPSIAEFVPLHLQEPDRYVSGARRKEYYEPEFYNVGQSGGGLSGKDIVILDNDDLDVLLWTVHPMHLTPLSREEVHDPMSLAGVFAPVGDPEFVARVNARRKLVSVLKG